LDWTRSKSRKALVPEIAVRKKDGKARGARLNFHDVSIEEVPVEMSLEQLHAVYRDRFAAERRTANSINPRGKHSSDFMEERKIPR